MSRRSPFISRVECAGSFRVGVDRRATVLAIGDAKHTAKRRARPDLDRLDRARALVQALVPSGSTRRRSSCCCSRSTDWKPICCAPRHSGMTSNWSTSIGSIRAAEVGSNRSAAGHRAAEIQVDETGCPCSAARSPAAALSPIRLNAAASAKSAKRKMPWSVRSA